MVNTGRGLVVLAFLIAYILPVQVDASGNVMVAAAEPLKMSVLSVDAAVVLEVKER